MPEYRQYHFDDNGKFTAVVISNSDTDISGIFSTAPFGCTFVVPLEYDPATQIPIFDGVIWVVHELSEFEPTLDEVKAEKIAELAQTRWEQETGGLTLPDGTEIKTDRESQALLTGASLYALQNASSTVEWKGVNGWVTLTATEIMQIATLVRNHVQAQFSKERDYAEKVNACGTVKDVQAVTWE